MSEPLSFFFPCVEQNNNNNNNKYTVNQTLLVSFFMLANTRLHVTSQCHDVTVTLIAIQCDCRFLKTGLVDHIGVLQIPITIIIIIIIIVNYCNSHFVTQMRTLHHDNLTRFVGACMEPGNVSLLTEYCPKGSLQVSFCMEIM